MMRKPGNGRGGSSLFSRRVSQLALLVGFGLAVSGGCGSDERLVPLPPGGDRPSNGSVSIEEALLSATAEDGQLAIRIPVRSLGRAANGSLNVSLLTVDGKKVLDSTSVEYAVPAGATHAVTASLPVPSNVAEPADWVTANLRIDDGSQAGLRLTSSLLRVVSPYELRLEGPQTLSEGKPVAYRVRAQHPLTLAPLAGVPVELHLLQEGSLVEKHEATTAATGDAVFPLTAPAAGSYEIVAHAARQGTVTDLDHPIGVVEPGRRVLLTTDKPIYQPGQLVHLRALALSPPKNTPLAGESVLFEIEDGKGNKIMKRELETDDYGIAASRFQLGRVLNMGSFKVRAVVGSTTTEKTVEVSRYALPRFDVDVELDQPWYSAGASVTGTLDADYFFGKSVAGADVVVEGITLDVGETVFQKVVTKTDADGKASFSLKLPGSLVGLPLEQGNALVTVRATVTDTAGQQVKKDTALVVAQDAVHVAIVPEATALVPGIENRLELFVTDPLGAPIAGAEAVVTAGGKTFEASSDEFGHAEVAWTPGQNDPPSVEVKVTPAGGKPITQSFSFTAQAGGEHVLVRTDKSVYALGESVTVEVIASEQEAHAYVDWLHEGQAVEMRTLDLANGRASFTMPLDTAFVGSNRIEAYVVDDDGNIARAGRTVFARTDSALDVELTTDQAQYAPGQPARLTFSVKDESGQPAVAALGVQIVDEAVFSLIDARPGLLRTYFELEDAYAEPHYEIQPPPGSLSDLLFDGTADQDPDVAQAAQTRAAAALAALGHASVTGLGLGSWQAVTAKAATLLAPYYEAERARLLPQVQQVALAHVNALGQAGCAPTQYWCETLQTGFYEALMARLDGAVVAYDFWGNAYTQGQLGWDGSLRLTSAGPDEQTASGDDTTLSFSYDELGLAQFGVPVVGEDGDMNAGGGGTGGSGFGGSGGMSGSGGGAAAAPGEAGPRVRKDFPETLYVNPAVITGPDGKATIDVDMADSITEWRVSTLAHSASGKLGGGTAGVTVFQDFFVDVNFPATLTRGDELTFPIAVYNYLATPQTVQIELEPAAWYTPLGPTTQALALEPGQVLGAAFPVRVETVGLQKLTVKGTGPGAADAVARNVLVVPDGKAFPSALSGALTAGIAQQSLTFPANAVPGSYDLYLNVYPAFLSQVVEGMDAMLQVPSGCFEQTTSTTWPNVLATRYMTDTDQITPEIQMKAESLISAGYQRLLTFEHQGGGFSWFGEQDPAPYLSVTAFGVMEFADMAKVHPVDEAMLERTKSWLAGQQKPDGSWEGDQSEFFSFHTSVVRNTAFVVWALASAGWTGPELAGGLAFVKGKIGSETDAYTLAMAANAYAVAAPNDATLSTLLEKLDQMKTVNGKKVSWDSGGTETNFYCGGNDAAVATTALVAYAMLLDGGYKSDVDGALEFLTSSKDPNGNFGSTQATIWTLRTLLLAVEKGTEGAVGSLEVKVDGAHFSTLELTEAQSDVMTTVDLASHATPGAHQVELAFLGTGKVSYNLVASHHLPWSQVPPDPAGPLAVSVGYDKTNLHVNETVTATVSVINQTPNVQSMILVTVGIPPGFAVETGDLDAYQNAGQLEQYELTGKQLTLYLSALAGAATATFQYRLRATMPVKAADGGAEAWLYYQPEQKTAAAATTVEVTE
jgi:hypothetical protein